MNRRELLQMIASVTGYAMIGSPLLMSACSSASPVRGMELSVSDQALLAEIAETIFPRTTTPGAKDVGVPEMIVRLVNNTYEDLDQQEFHNGLAAIRSDTMARYGQSFENLPGPQRAEFLNELNQTARNFVRPHGVSAHYFIMMKQLTIFSYFSTEQVQTGVLRMVPVPGRFDGDYPYVKGETAWAI
ncbi:MAG: gluconate 2-dehydrogenase subunit 3 family protein [Pseudohongiella sp.]|nr:gluconate 2-dehydrogenase subunit 3 family protein [Pseudohongiella sp.]